MGKNQQLSLRYDEPSVKGARDGEIHDGNALKQVASITSLQPFIHNGDCLQIRSDRSDKMKTYLDETVSSNGLGNTIFDSSWIIFISREERNAMG